MKVEKAWEFSDRQTFESGRKRYNVHAAVTLAKDLPVVDMSIEQMYRAYGAPCANEFMDFVAHVRQTNDADLNCPVLLNEEAVIIDGRHRLAKALLEGRETIKCKKFDKDPTAIFDWV